MKAWTAPKLIATCIGAAVFWALWALGCAFVGYRSFGWPRIEEVRDERLLAIAVASLVGAALGAAGTAYQAVLRNPLAEPYLLGVSGGATLAAYLAAISAASLSTGALSTALAPLGLQGASFIGAALALAVVMTLAQRRGRLEPVTLLLVGVIVNAVCGSLYLLWFHLNLRQEVSMGSGGPFRFLIGGINTNLTIRQIATAGVIIAAGWAALLYASGELNLAMLGEAEAEALGARIQRLRWVALLVASLVTAAAVAISGPIGFVGLVAPHMGRLVVGTDQRRLLPVATAFGAVLLAVADAASRALSQKTYGPLPVGVLTGLLGGPFFLFLLWHGRMGRLN